MGLKAADIMQIGMLTVLIVFVSISFTVFDFLQGAAYLTWGLCILFFLIMGVLFIRKPLISIFDLGIITYLMVLLTFTIINGTDIKTAVYRSIEVLLLMMIINYKNNIALVVKTCAIVLSLCVYINLLVMILFPDWMFAANDVSDSYLLGGNYNQTGSRLITAIVINCVCAKFGKKWIVNIVFLTIISIITLALIGSKTALSCIILFTLFCIIPSTRIQKFITVSFFTFFLLFQFTVVFNGKSLHNNTLAVYIIEDLLKKDITFTHRTYLWDSAGNLFSESPIIGYGMVDTDWYISKMNSYAIGPHNFIYSILINGGLTLITILIVICSTALNSILKNYDKIANVLLMGIATMFFMMTMEVYPFFFLFLLLYITYHYKALNIQKKLVHV